MTRALVLASFATISVVVTSPPRESHHPLVAAPRDQDRADSARASGNWAAYVPPFGSYWLKLTQNDSLVTGLGAYCGATSNCDAWSVSGTYRPPRIDLKFHYHAGKPAPFPGYIGTVENDSLVAGTLSGHGSLNFTRRAFSPWDSQPGFHPWDSRDWPPP
jgi:hypothetical protein